MVGLPLDAVRTRKFPDLVEEFLNKCCERKKREGKYVMTMNHDFIEDAHAYKLGIRKGDKKKQFYHKDEIMNDDYEQCKNYEVDINNQPLIIMAEERKVDLLQHDLCMEILLRKWNQYGRRFYFFQLFFFLFFLLALNLFILSSPSPLDSPAASSFGTLPRRQRSMELIDWLISTQPLGFFFLS